MGTGLYVLLFYCLVSSRLVLPCFVVLCRVLSYLALSRLELSSIVICCLFFCSLVFVRIFSPSTHILSSGRPDGFSDVTIFLSASEVIGGHRYRYSVLLYLVFGIRLS
jgi:hypothetical protein